MIKLNLPETAKPEPDFLVEVLDRGDHIDIEVNSWSVLRLSEKNGKFIVNTYTEIEDEDFNLDDEGAVIITAFD